MWTSVVVAAGIGRAFGRLGLLARFTLLGTAVALLVATGAAWVIESRVTDFATTQLTERAMDQVLLGVLDEVTPDDLAAPYPPAKLALLADRLDARLARVRHERSSIIRLHLFGRDGTVIYSDLPAKRGTRIDPAGSPLLTQALGGTVSRKWSGLAEPESADLRARYGTALEVYVPFRLGGELVGAYELYQEVGAFQPIRSLVWSTTFVGFALCFLALLGVVHAAARQIDRQQTERVRLIRQALHDPLSGLPNRAYFRECLDQSLARAAREGHPVAVLLLDLDNFKVINDTFGHEGGDRLLVTVAQRLRACARDRDMVARLGGDEFTVLLGSITRAEEAMRVAERIVATLRQPLRLGEREITITASIGVAIRAPGHEQAESLLRRADLAMYRAKAAGKARCQLWTAGEMAPTPSAAVRIVELDG